MKMIQFNLPESAFKCKGIEIVAGHQFKDGRHVTTEDQAKSMAPILIRFHGVTAEAVELDDEPADDESSSDSSLQSTVTKPGE